MTDFELTTCQKHAWADLQESQNLFITGSAGTGKSTLIRQFQNHQGPASYPVLASTGAAAVLLGGQTFHSFFGLGVMQHGFEQTIERALKRKAIVKRLTESQGIILDEVSMLPGPALRAAEMIARKARNKDEPWGGLRVIAVGDFAQLPPVEGMGGPKPWAFQDQAWARSRFLPVVLETIVRTHDEPFIRVLNAVRDGAFNEEVGEFLNSRNAEGLLGEPITALFGRKADVDRVNQMRLESLPGEEAVIPSHVQGDEMAMAQLLRAAPIGESLTLKEDALVMIRQNDFKGRWVNGSQGYVRKLPGEDFNEDTGEITERETVGIELLNGEYVEIPKTTFHVFDAEGRKTASLTNFPISLAYALTIHKAQGATIERMAVALKGLWEAGQAYVAMSRVRAGNGLFVLNWSKESFKADPMVKQFHRSIGMPVSSSGEEDEMDYYWE